MGPERTQQLGNFTLKPIDIDKGKLSVDKSETKESPTKSIYVTNDKLIIPQKKKTEFDEYRQKMNPDKVGVNQLITPKTKSTAISNTMVSPSNNPTLNVPEEEEHLDWHKDIAEEKTDPDFDKALKHNIPIGFTMDGGFDDSKESFTRSLSIDLSNLDKAEKELDSIYTAKLYKQGIDKNPQKMYGLLGIKSPIKSASEIVAEKTIPGYKILSDIKDAIPLWEDGSDIISGTLHKFAKTILGFDFTNEEAEQQKQYIKAKDYIHALKAYKKTFDTNQYNFTSNAYKSSQEAIAFGITTGFYNYFNKPLKHLIYGRAGDGETPIDAVAPYIRDGVILQEARNKVLQEGAKYFQTDDPEVMNEYVKQATEPLTVVESISQNVGDLISSLTPIGGFGIANKVSKGISALSAAGKEALSATRIGEKLFEGVESAELLKAERIGDISQELNRDVNFVKTFKKLPTVEKMKTLLRYAFNPKMDAGVIKTEGKIINSIHNSFGSTLHGINHMVTGMFVNEMLRLDPTMTSDDVINGMKDMAILGAVNGAVGRIFAKSARFGTIMSKSFSNRFPTQEALDHYLAMTDKIAYTTSMLPSMVGINIFKDYMDNMKLDMPAQVYLNDIITSMLFGFGDFKYLAEEKGNYKRTMDYLKHNPIEEKYSNINLEYNPKTSEIPVMPVEETIRTMPTYVSDFDYVKSHSDLTKPLTVDNLVNQSLHLMMSDLTTKEKGILKNLSTKYGDMKIEPKKISDEYFAEIDPSTNTMYFNNERGYFNNKYHDPSNIGKALIHELAHKETAERYDIDKEYANGVTSLRKWITNNIPESTMDKIIDDPSAYAIFEETGMVSDMPETEQERIKHDKEFMAYLFGTGDNPFTQILKRIKIETPKGNYTFLDRIRNTIASHKFDIHKEAIEYVLGNNSNETATKEMANVLKEGEKFLVPNDGTTLHMTRDVLNANLNMSFTPDEYNRLQKTIEAVEKDNFGFTVDPAGVYRDFLEKHGYAPSANDIITKIKDDVQGYRKRLNDGLEEEAILSGWGDLINELNDVEVSGYDEIDMENVQSNPVQARNEKASNEGLPPEIKNISALDRTNLEFLYKKLGFESNAEMYKVLNNVHDKRELAFRLKQRLPKEISEEFTKNPESFVDFVSRVNMIIKNHRFIKPTGMVVKVQRYKVGSNIMEDVSIQHTKPNVRGKYVNMEGKSTFLPGNLERVIGENGLLTKAGLSRKSADIINEMFNGDIVFPQDITLETSFKGSKYGPSRKRVTKIGDLYGDATKLNRIKNKLVQDGLLILPTKNEGTVSHKIRRLMKTPEGRLQLLGIAKNIHDAIFKHMMSVPKLWEGRYKSEQIRKVLNLIDIDKLREGKMVDIDKEFPAEYLNKYYQTDDPSIAERKNKILEHINTNLDTYKDIIQTLRKNAAVYYDPGTNRIPIGNPRIPNYLLAPEHTAKSKDETAEAIRLEHNSLAMFLIDPSGRSRIPRTEKAGTLFDNNRIKKDFGKFPEKYLNASQNKSLVHFKNVEDFYAMIPELRSNMKELLAAGESKRAEIIDKALKGTGKKRIGKDIYNVTIFTDHRWFKQNPDSEYKDIERDIIGDGFDSATIVLREKDWQIGNNIFGTDPNETRVLKTLYSNVNNEGALTIKHAEFYPTVDGHNSGRQDRFIDFVDRLRANSDIGYITSEDAVKMPGLATDPKPVLLPEYNAYVEFDRLGHPIKAYAKEGDSNDEQLLNSIVADIGKRVLSGNVPGFIKQYIPVTGDGAMAFLQAGHPSSRQLETQGGASGVMDAIQVVRGGNFFEGLDGEKAYAGFTKLAKNAREKGKEKLIDSYALFNTLNKLVKGISITNLEQRARYNIVDSPKDTELKRAARGMKRLADFLERTDEETAKSFYPFIELYGKDHAVQELRSSIVGTGEGARLDPRKAYKLITAYKGLFFKSKFHEPGQATLFMSMLKDDMANMQKVRTSGIYTTLAPTALGNITALDRLIAKETKEYSDLLKVQEVEGKISGYEAQERLQAFKQKMLAKKEWAKSPEGNIFDETGRLADHGNGIIISEHEYDMLKKHAKKFGYEFGIGSRVFGKRTPVDNIDSQGAFFIAGIVDGAGMSIVNAKTSARVFGTDYDKDGFQVMVPDDVYTKDIFDMHHKHWLDMGINQGLWKADANIRSEQAKLYSNGSSVEAFHLETSPVYRIHQPHIEGHLEDAEATSQGIGGSIALRTSIRNLFQNIDTHVEKDAFGHEVITGTIKFPEPIKVGNAKDNMKVREVTLSLPKRWEEEDGVRYDKLSSDVNTVVQGSVDSFNQRNYDPYTTLMKMPFYSYKDESGKELKFNKEIDDPIQTDLMRYVIDTYSGNAVARLGNAKSYTDISKTLKESIKPTLDVLEQMKRKGKEQGISNRSHLINVLDQVKDININAAHNDPSHKKSLVVIETVGTKKVLDALNVQLDYSSMYNHLVKELGLDNKLYFELMGGLEPDKKTPTLGVNGAIASLLNEMSNVVAKNIPLDNYLELKKLKNENYGLWGNNLYYDPVTNAPLDIFKWLSWDKRASKMMSIPMFRKSLGRVMHLMNKEFGFIGDVGPLNKPQGKVKVRLTDQLIAKGTSTVPEYYVYNDGWIGQYQKRTNNETGTAQWVLTDRNHINSIFNENADLENIRNEIFGIPSSEGSEKGIPMKELMRGMGPLMVKPRPIQKLLKLDKPITDRFAMKLRHEAVLAAAKAIPGVSKPLMEAVYTAMGYVKPRQKTLSTHNGYGASAKSTSLFPRMYLETENIKKGKIPPIAHTFVKTARDVYGYSPSEKAKSVEQQYYEAVTKYPELVDYINETSRYNPYDMLSLAKADGIEPKMFDNTKLLDYADRVLDIYGKKEIPFKSPIIEDQTDTEGNKLHISRRILNNDAFDNVREKLSTGKFDIDFRAAFKKLREGTEMPNSDKIAIASILNNKRLDQMTIDDYATIHEKLIRPSLEDQSKKIAKKKKLTPEQQKALFAETDAHIDAISPHYVKRLEKALGKSGVSETDMLAVKTKLLFDMANSLNRFAKSLKKERGKIYTKLFSFNVFKSMMPSSVYANAEPNLKTFSPDHVITKANKYSNGKKVYNTQEEYKIIDMIEHSTGTSQLFPRLPEHEVNIFQWFRILDFTKNRLAALHNSAAFKNMLGSTKKGIERDNIVGNNISLSNIERRIKDITGRELFGNEEEEGLINMIVESSLFNEDAKASVTGKSNIPGREERLTLQHNIFDEQGLDDLVSEFGRIDPVTTSFVARGEEGFNASELQSIKNAIRLKALGMQTSNYLGLMQDQVESFRDTHFPEKEDPMRAKLDQAIEELAYQKEKFSNASLKDMIRMSRKSVKPIQEVLNVIETEGIQPAKEQVAEYIRHLNAMNKKYGHIKADIYKSRNFNAEKTREAIDDELANIDYFRSIGASEEDIRAYQREHDHAQSIVSALDYYYAEQNGNIDKDKLPVPNVEKLLVSQLKAQIRDERNQGIPVDITDPATVEYYRNLLQYNSGIIKDLYKKQDQTNGGGKTPDQFYDELVDDVIKEVQLEQTKSRAYYDLVKKAKPDLFPLDWEDMDNEEKKEANKEVMTLLERTIHQTIENENLQDQINTITSTLLNEAKGGYKIDADRNKKLFGNLDIHDFLLAIRPELAEDTEWYDFGLNNLKDNIGNMLNNQLINLSHSAYDLYLRNPDTDPFTYEIALGRIGEMFGNKSVYMHKVEKEDIPSLEVGTPVRVTYKTVNKEVRTIIGYHAGVHKNTTKVPLTDPNGEPLVDENGVPTYRNVNDPRMIVIDPRRSEAGKNVVIAIPKDNVVDVTEGMSPIDRASEKAVKKAIKSVTATEIAEAIKDIEDNRNPSKMSHTLAKINFETEHSLHAKIKRLQELALGGVSAGYYLGGTYLASVATGGGLALANLFGADINPALVNGLLYSGGMGLMYRMLRIFGQNLYGTTGLISQETADRKLGTGILGSTIGTTIDAVRALIHSFSGESGKSSSMGAAQVMALLSENNETGDTGGLGTQITNLDINVGSKPKNRLLVKTGLSDSKAMATIKKKIADIVPRYSTKDLVNMMSEKIKDAETTNYKLKKVHANILAENTKEFRREVQNILNEYIDSQAQAKGTEATSYLSGIMKRSYRRKVDGKREYDYKDRLDKVLITHGGYSLREIQSMRPYLFDKLTNGLSLNGAVQRMEIYSTNKAYNMNWNRLSQINERRIEMNKALAERKRHMGFAPGNDIVDNSGDLSKFLLLNLEQSMVYKSIGNYQKTIYHRTPTMSLLNMFSNFTKERFLNTSTYLLERKKMYDYIKKELAASDGYASAMKEFAGLGMPIANTNLSDPYKQLRRLAFMGGIAFGLTTYSGWIADMLGLSFLSKTLNKKLDDIYNSVLTLGNESAIVGYSLLAATLRALTLADQDDKRKQKSAVSGTGRMITGAVQSAGTGLLTSQLSSTIGLLGMFAISEIGAKTLSREGNRKYRRELFWKEIGKRSSQLVNTLTGTAISPFDVIVQSKEPLHKNDGIKSVNGTGGTGGGTNL